MEVCAVVRFCYILLYYTHNCLLGVLFDYCTTSRCCVVLCAVLCSSVVGYFVCVSYCITTATR
jgi:hypothetical protein